VPLVDGTRTTEKTGSIFLEFISQREDKRTLPATTFRPERNAVGRSLLSATTGPADPEKGSIPLSVIDRSRSAQWQAWCRC
jgi:hypothetical protein